MSLERHKLLTAIILAFGLVLLSGCLPDMELPKPLLVETPPPLPPEHQGPPLFCKTGRGEAQTGHEWYEYADTSFMLYPGERVNVQLPPRKDGTAAPLTVQTFFDHDGQKMIFCPVVDGMPGERIACASLYVLDDDLHAGIKRTLDIPNAVKSGAVTCAYQQVNIKKLTSYGTGGGN